MCSQVLGVPIDIISQRQMVQGVSVKGADGANTQLKVEQCKLKPQLSA